MISTWAPVVSRALLDTCSLHPLETLPVGLVDLRHLVPVLLQLVDELGVVQLAVASTGLDDLGLFLQGEVLPRVARPDNIAEERENLVVRDGARVGEIVDARVAVLGQKNRCGQQVVQDSVAVGDVDDAVVLGNLRDKVARVKVVRDRHSQPQDEAVGIVLHDLYTGKSTRVSQPASQPGPSDCPRLSYTPGGSEGEDGKERGRLIMTCDVQLTSSTCALVSE